MDCQNAEGCQMNEQDLKDEIENLTDKLYFAERARDGHYYKLQIALKRIEELEQEGVKW
jgi:cell division protein FtsB